MGYITDFKNVEYEEEETSEQNAIDDMPKLKASEVNIRDYHRILSIILEDFKNVQKKGKMKSIK